MSLIRLRVNFVKLVVPIISNFDRIFASSYYYYFDKEVVKTTRDFLLDYFKDNYLMWPGVKKVQTLDSRFSPAGF